MSFQSTGGCVSPQPVLLNGATQSGSKTTLRRDHNSQRTGLVWSKLIEVDGEIGCGWIIRGIRTWGRKGTGDC